MEDNLIKLAGRLSLIIYELMVRYKVNINYLVEKTGMTARTIQKDINDRLK